MKTKEFVLYHSCPQKTLRVGLYILLFTYDLFNENKIAKVLTYIVFSRANILNVEK